jgi:hypothetical protein
LDQHSPSPLKEIDQPTVFLQVMLQAKLCQWVSVKYQIMDSQQGGLQAFCPKEKPQITDKKVLTQRQF